ncbi:MAG TPA: hypothetical protein VGV17_23835 [Bosea sp. (in: a-proteobacteria)]|jgi:hypothetical protein|uniref:hypothetical protein n=1 Tax=Bosea sp. (in: a-proteobacteria) TaxID=1871050 RepID=UPI002DDD2AF9|nr:hypothetical protein [Bosea sp. (in: a-proteobacteria)]HEV2556793.1 hypothetical protein [Bosea sp. (in: a-proteobacteria)]
MHRLRFSPTLANAPAKSKVADSSNLFLWLVFAILVLSAIVLARLNLFNENISGRMYLHALPTAISYLYHGHNADHTALSEIANVFYAFGGHYPPDGIDASIRRALQVKVLDRTNLYFWGADDRGLGEFVVASFALFGPRHAALIMGYFVLLGAGAMLLACQERARPQNFVPVLCLVAGCCVASWYLVFLTADFRDVLTSVPRNPAANITESRGFDVLALLPACGLFLLFKNRRRNWVFFAAAHVLYLYAIVLIRSSALTAGLVVAIAMLVSLSVDRFRGTADRQAMVRLAVIFGLLIAGHLAGKLYMRATHHPAYFAEQGTRTVWHNLLMGLADTKLGKRYVDGLTDPAAVAGVIKWMRERDDPRLEQEWAKRYVPNTFGYPGFDVTQYEAAARSMYLHLLTRRPLEVAGKVVFGMKFAGAYLFRASLQLVKRQWLAFVALAAIVCMFRVRGPTRADFAVFLCSGALVGLLPTVVFYFVPTSLIISTGAMIALVLLLISMTASAIVDRYSTSHEPSIRAAI